MNRLRRNTPTLTEKLDKTILVETLTKLFPKAKKETRKIIDSNVETEWRNEWNVTIQEVYKITKK